MDTSATRPGVMPRLRHEMRSYALTVLYLSVCFAAIQLYKAALLTEESLRYTTYGFALIKAAVLGKFLMLGEAAKVGRRVAGEPLLRGALRGSLLLLLVLVVLTAIEELVAGALHGLHPAQVLDEHVAGGRWAEFLAYCLLVWLFLIPYLGLKHLSELLGPEAFGRALRGERLG
ncbi:hypothetical protein DFH01_26185 [Falsiroseomonas bella]|uniref:Uncharacterized protein n=1 Tax=Falsiroseomonas bella TaxID=2184016 RepID=A0A317F4M8_9PROT|nr:hypothetical protein [Falsiroseomonas bella]PWS34121.1 hypothetical protein DFH01_26185 [Falsiroseomonas bella]